MNKFAAWLFCSTLITTSSYGVPNTPHTHCKNPQNTMEMNECAAQEGDTADAQLNKTYTQLMAMITPETKNALRDAQRAWIKWRDADCAFGNNLSTGGSLHALFVQQCITSITKQRTATLNRWLRCKNEEGDGACPAFK